MDGNLLHMGDVDRITDAWPFLQKGKPRRNGRDSVKGKAFAGFPLAFLCCCTKKDTRLGVFFMELMIRFELTTSSLPRTRSTY